MPSSIVVCITPQRLQRQRSARQEQECLAGQPAITAAVCQVLLGLRNRQLLCAIRLTDWRAGRHGEDQHHCRAAALRMTKCLAFTLRFGWYAVFT